MASVKNPVRTNDEIRSLMLLYFHERNQNATSIKGKKGSAVKISVLKSELKQQHGLSQQEVIRNLNYLINQKWVEEQSIEKRFPTQSGSVVPSTTFYYQITAAGTDKIEGPSEFTMPKFHDIKIEAAGQNIITLGDGNQINATFKDLGQALLDLRKTIIESSTEDTEKLVFVANIESLQTQLATPRPNKGIIRAAWEVVQRASAIKQCAAVVSKVASHIESFLL